MSLRRLRAALAAEGGTLAAALAPESEVSRSSIAAAPVLDAPRIAGNEPDYELLLGMIGEGVRLHYGKAELVRPADPDLALLLGDQLYALGLARLAALGDVEAVAQLGDVISLISQAESAGDSELADAVWKAGIVAVGWGTSDALEGAKRMAREGSPWAREALVNASAETACDARARDGRLDVDDSLHTPFN